MQKKSVLDFGEFKDSEFEIFDGPVINSAISPDVIGVLGKDVRLACHVTNLENKTVMPSKLPKYGHFNKLISYFFLY